MTRGGEGEGEREKTKRGQRLVVLETRNLPRNSSGVESRPSKDPLSQTSLSSGFSSSWAAVRAVRIYGRENQSEEILWPGGGDKTYVAGGQCLVEKKQKKKVSG